MQLGSTSGFEGHLKAAVSSKETGCSYAGWPRKLIVFHGIKGISGIHWPLLRKEMDCIWSCKMHIQQTKLDKFWPTGKQEFGNMSGKPRLTYLNGRGRMESIRWLLAAAGVEFEEVYLETKEQYDKLIKDGFLLFQQVPLVEIDGMKMVQTRAIMSYIAGKYNLYGKDLKERAMIDMYVEGISDLMQMILVFPFSPPDAKEKNLESIKERATNRYFPVFEKVLKQHGQDFLVGNKFSWADVQLMEAILAVEEKIPAVLSGFPQLQVFKTKMSNMPTIKKFLQPGSPRKPPPDAHYVETVLKMFKI